MRTWYGWLYDTAEGPSSVDTSDPDFADVEVRGDDGADAARRGFFQLAAGPEQSLVVVDPETGERASAKAPPPPLAHPPRRQTVAEYSFTLCAYGETGDEPGENTARVGQDAEGWWWVDQGDDQYRKVVGVFRTQDEADKAAQATAASMDEECSSAASEEEEEAPYQVPTRPQVPGQLIGLVVNPKSGRLFGVYDKLDTVTEIGRPHLRKEGSTHGRGYFDSTHVSGCPRTHVPAGVLKKGTGLGLCLYTGLLAQAWWSLGKTCVGSKDKTRSLDALVWWRKAAASGLAEDLGGDSFRMTLESATEAGILIWVAAATAPVERLLIRCWEHYLPALLLMDPGEDPQVLGMVESMLDQGGATREELEAWRAERRAALVANPRKASPLDPFRPALAAETAELYAPLADLL